MQLTPQFSVSADGIDVTGRFAGRNVELEVIDATGVESDSAEFVISDPLAEVAPPRRGAILAISMGYLETGLVPMGLFKVDQVTFKGYPHEIRINARAADNKKEMKERRIKDYTNKTFGEIVSEIAGRHGLTPKIAGDLASHRFTYFSKPDESYIGQHEESDASFLTRVADRVGGFFAVKNGHLIVARKGDGQSISGAEGLVILTPDKLIDRDAYEVSWKDKPVHGQVESSYFDRKKVTRKPVTVGGGDGVVYRFRDPFPDEKQARKAAEGKQRELERDEGSAKFSAWGDPTIRAEMKLMASGIRAGVDGLWTITRAAHRIDGSGFVSKIEGETKPKK
jgi:hypothetical protein